MTVTPVVASYVPNYANRKSYITAGDYLEAPTGTDTTQLIPGGTVEENILALTGVIERGCSACDTYCQKVLAATVDTDIGEFRLYRDGTIRVPLTYTPVIMVTGVSIGWDPSSMQPLTSLAGIWVGAKVARIPILGAAPSSMAPMIRGRSWTSIYAAVTYLNGWAHTTTTAVAAVGATSLTTDDVLGAVPGLPMTVYDGDNTERVVVSSSYVVGNSPLLLASATRQAHAAGVTVSAMPPDIRQAAISWTSGLIKKRGGEAIVLASIHQQPDRKTLGEPGANTDIGLAKELLQPYRRIL